MNFLIRFYFRFVFLTWLIYYSHGNRIERKKVTFPQDDYTFIPSYLWSQKKNSRIIERNNVFLFPVKYFLRWLPYFYATVCWYYCWWHVNCIYNSVSKECPRGHFFRPTFIVCLFRVNHYYNITVRWSIFSHLFTRDF